MVVYGHPRITLDTGHSDPIETRGPSWTTLSTLLYAEFSRRHPHTWLPTYHRRSLSGHWTKLDVIVMILGNCELMGAVPVRIGPTADELPHQLVELSSTWQAT